MFQIYRRRTGKQSKRSLTQKIVVKQKSMSQNKIHKICLDCYNDLPIEVPDVIYEKAKEVSLCSCKELLRENNHFEENKVSKKKISTYQEELHAIKMDFAEILISFCLCFYCTLTKKISTQLCDEVKNSWVFL